MPKEQGAENGSGPRILIVEDESIVALDIRSILNARGYRVVGWVTRGEEAVAEARRTGPDLILMDIRLCGEMSGIEAAGTIRRQLGIPSLFLTSFSDREILDQAKKSDPLGYILKPFEERELGAAIEIALHRWQVEKGLREALRENRDVGGATESSRTDPSRLVITTLGRFEISLGGRILARLEDFSQAQRELLGLLLCSPTLRMSCKNIELALWPDSSPQKARSCFDSLLLRFRKKMTELIGPLSVGDYLFLHRGVLCLENCRVDVVELARHHKEARVALKNADRGAAETSLSAALDLFRGAFMAGSCLNDLCFEFERELERSISACTSRLGALLIEDGRIEEAIEMVDRTLQVDPTNDALIRNICQILRRSTNPARVETLLHRYKQALRKAGFPEKEIAQILVGI